MGPNRAVGQCHRAAAGLWARLCHQRLPLEYTAGPLSSLLGHASAAQHPAQHPAQPVLPMPNPCYLCPTRATYAQPVLPMPNFWLGCLAVSAFWLGCLAAYLLIRLP